VSTLSAHLEGYAELRRALGYKPEADSPLLSGFGRHLDAAGQVPSVGLIRANKVRTAHLLAWRAAALLQAAATDVTFDAGANLYTKGNGRRDKHIPLILATASLRVEYRRDEVTGGSANGTIPHGWNVDDQIKELWGTLQGI
jgi:hypothetical protein